jgi:uncharacterized protein YjbI with pentapeptide repeats
MHLSKFQLIKLLTSLALPLAVALFTLITTIQNRQIAEQNREQDLKQAEDEQRQNVFVSYINDISHYRDKYSSNLTNNLDKLLYIRTKTLTVLRKLDNERKKYVFLFLKESFLLSADEQSLLVEANFNGIRLNQYDCYFKHTTFLGIYFENVSFTNCVFENVTFRYVYFHRANLTNSIFYLSQFYACQMDYVNFQQTIISESIFDRSLLSYADFRHVKFDFTKFNNVNFTKAIFSDTSIQMKNTKITNSLLWNQTFSSIDEIHIHSNFCFSFDRWSPQPIDGFRIDNCTLITTISNANLSIDIIEPFSDRMVLIDANQAEFFFEVKQKYTMTFLSITIYYVGVERGVFETRQIGMFNRFSSREI